MTNRNSIARIFISPDENRLRAGWRLIVQLLILAVLALILGTFWSLSRYALGLTPGLNLAESEALTSLAITASVFIGRLWLDRRSFASLGLRITLKSWQDLLAGFLIGAVIMALVFAAERAAGLLTIKSVAWNGNSIGQISLMLAAMLIIFILAGWQEELYFRGYLLQNLKDGLNLGWAVIISSLIFGAAHLGNPNSLAASVIGIFLAGVLMALGYARTRRLWLPIGLHIGWNFFEGPVFGFPVSGFDAYHLFQIKVTGSTLVTGGSFGPEAGLVLLPALALGALLVWGYTAKKSRKSRQV